MGLFAIAHRSAISYAAPLRASASAVVSEERPFLLTMNHPSPPLRATRGLLRDETSCHDTLCQLAAGIMQSSPGDAAFISSDRASYHDKPLEMGGGRSPNVQSYPVTSGRWRATELSAHVAWPRSCSFGRRRQFSSTSSGAKLPLII